MNKFKDYMTENTKGKILNELFIKFGEISSLPSGKLRDVQIARLAMIAEMDAMNLYESMVAQATDSDLKDVLQEVANEEKIHSGEFEYLLEKLDPEWDELEDEGEEEAEKSIEGDKK